MGSRWLLVLLAACATGGGRSNDQERLHVHMLPGEPRVLADGKTVMFATFTCGLYTVTGVDTSAPTLSFVYAFPGDNCAVPVTVGRYWIQTGRLFHDPDVPSLSTEAVVVPGVGTVRAEPHAAVFDRR